MKEPREGNRNDEKENDAIFAAVKDIEDFSNVDFLHRLNEVLMNVLLLLTLIERRVRSLIQVVVGAGMLGIGHDGLYSELYPFTFRAVSKYSSY